MSQLQLIPTTCREPDCIAAVHGHGWCQSHYDRLVATPRRRGMCSICGGPKPAGLGRKICDDCKPISAERAKAKRKEYERAYYEVNRDSVLARQSERYWNDPEYRRAQSERARQWALDHPDEIAIRRRRSWAKNNYGLTLDELDALLARGCALCGSTEQLQVDHCHTTGKVRDALCRSCNTGLGQFGDDPVRLRAAADYLESHRKETPNAEGEEVQG